MAPGRVRATTARLGRLAAPKWHSGSARGPERAEAEISRRELTGWALKLDNKPGKTTAPKTATVRRLPFKEWVIGELALRPVSALLAATGQRNCSLTFQTFQTLSQLASPAHEPDLLPYPANRTD